MACDRSPIRAPGPAAAMPAASARCGGLDQLDAPGRAALPHHEADRGVGGDAVEAHREVEGQQVAVGEPLVARTAVQHGVVDRRADVVAEGAATEGRGVVDVAGLGAGLADHLGGPAVEVEQVGADLAARAQGLEDVGDEGAGPAGAVDLGGGEDLDHRASIISGPASHSASRVAPLHRSSRVRTPSATSTEVRVSIGDLAVAVEPGLDAVDVLAALDGVVGEVGHRHVGGLVAHRSRVGHVGHRLLLAAAGRRGRPRRRSRPGGAPRRSRGRRSGRSPARARRARPRGGRRR